MKDNRWVKLYKVNKSDDDKPTNKELLGNEKNLTYITQAQLLDRLGQK